MLIKEKLLQNGWGPGGWQFHHPETGWHAPNPMSFTAPQQAENIRKHRLANPRVFKPEQCELAVCLADLEHYTLARWKATYTLAGLQRFLENPDDSLKKKNSGTYITNPSPRSLLGKAVALADDEADPVVLEEWFGAGGTPVGSAVSEARAGICASCRGNQKAGWRDSLTVAGAKALRQYLGVKAAKKLSSSLDKELGLCCACRCVLELKIHTPLEYAQLDIDEDRRAKLKSFNPDCWLLQAQ